MENEYDNSPFPVPTEEGGQKDNKEVNYVSRPLNYRLITGIIFLVAIAGIGIYFQVKRADENEAD